MSRHHVKLNPRRWARVRRQVLERAGWRSERSGKAGRLEVDHIKPLDRGGDLYDLSNLQVLTRREHIEKTQRENRRPLSPAEAAWKEAVAELIVL